MTAAALLPIAEIAMLLGQVERATRHPDGATPETDTTHTVMLALMALAVADEWGLDGSLMAAFALVHDLVEARAGDTPTARALGPGAKAAKDAREAEALAWLLERFNAHPRLTDLLRRYEAQQEPEARAVRVLDKVAPTLTHTLNDGAAVRALGLDGPELMREHRAQVTRLSVDMPEMGEPLALLHDSCLLSEQAFGGDS